MSNKTNTIKLNDTDKMVAHMLHRRQVASLLELQDLVLRYKARGMSNEFRTAVDALLQEALINVEFADVTLMDQHKDSAAIGSKNV
jgi:hypothetical protein